MAGNNIILVGFMGTGKTVVGKALAEVLNFRYIDTDAMIEAAARKTIPEIFGNEGEDAFRKYESDAVKHLLHLHDYVVSTGGGVVLSDENIENMKNAGVMICLTATPDVIFERTRHNDYRPLLQTSDPMKKIKSLLKFRDPFYRRADHTIDTSNLTVEEVVQAILKIRKNEE